MIDVNNLLQQTIELNASDLHLIVGSPPTIRIEGELKVLANSGILTPENILEGLKQTLTGEQFERLNVNKEIDFSLSFSEKARFRVNAYTQKGSLAVAFRSIPLIIPEIENLGLPKIVHNF